MGNRVSIEIFIWYCKSSSLEKKLDVATFGSSCATGMELLLSADHLALLNRTA